jgi:hypothetical protein
MTRTYASGGTGRCRVERFQFDERWSLVLRELLSFVEDQTIEFVDVDPLTFTYAP